MTKNLSNCQIELQMELSSNTVKLHSIQWEINDLILNIFWIMFFVFQAVVESSLNAFEFSDIIIDEGQRVNSDMHFVDFNNRNYLYAMTQRKVRQSFLLILRYNFNLTYNFGLKLIISLIQKVIFYFIFNSV